MGNKFKSSHKLNGKKLVRKAQDEKELTDEEHEALYEEIEKDMETNKWFKCETNSIIDIQNTKVKKKFLGFILYAKLLDESSFIVVSRAKEPGVIKYQAEV